MRPVIWRTEDDGRRIKDYRDDKGKLRSRPQNTQYLFLPGISWGKIGSGATSFRYRGEGFGFNDAAPTLFGNNPFPLLAALNTSIYKVLLQIRGGTLNMTCGVVEELPLLGYDSVQLQETDVPEDEDGLIAHIVEKFNGGPSMAAM